MKKAEDTNDLILCFHEYGYGQVTTSVKSNLPVNRLFMTDLMEHPLGETIDDTPIFVPNEIHPVKVSLGG